MRDLAQYQKFRERLHAEYVQQLESARIAFGVTQEEVDEIEAEEHGYFAASADQMDLPSVPVAAPTSGIRKRGKKKNFSDKIRDEINAMGKPFKLNEIMERLIKVDSRFERRRASVGTFLWRSAQKGKLVRIVEKEAGALGNTYEKI